MITFDITPTHQFKYLGCEFKIFHTDIGGGLTKHEHTYPHATICHAGEIVIRKEGKEIIANKDSGAFDLPANEWHEIEALQNNTIFVNISSEGKY